MWWAPSWLLPAATWVLCWVGFRWHKGPVWPMWETAMTCIMPWFHLAPKIVWATKLSVSQRSTWHLSSRVFMKQQQPLGEKTHLDTPKETCSWRHPWKEVIHAKGVHSQRDCSPSVTHARKGTAVKGPHPVDSPQCWQHISVLVIAKLC